MTRRVKIALSAAMIPIALAVGLGPCFYRPWESPTLHAHRACAECADFSPDEVDRLIETMRTAPGTREDKLRAFRPQSTTDARACLPCAEAIVDAADRMNQP